jgi:radical SAM PhpK family P-methyltransferase
MIDCLIIGFNDYDFQKYVEMVRGMGTDSGAYRDLNLAFIEYDNNPHRALDILTHFYNQNKSRPAKPFHNVDFLWPTIVYLGSYLSRRGCTFDYVNLFHFEKEKLKEKLTTRDILTVAITTTLYVIAQPIHEIVTFIRQYNESVKIVVGGPFIGNLTASTEVSAVKRLYKYIGADAYVDSNEGEFALFSIIRSLKNGLSLDMVNNIAYKKGAEYVITPKSVESNSLEDNPIDYTLFPKEEVGEFISIRTGKSCPFSCFFCGFPARAGKYQFLAPELVEAELNKIRNIGTVTTLSFLDDSFNVPKERFKAILRVMIQNRYGFKWNAYYRSDYGDEETIALMAEAGCEGVFLGIESGSDTMLKNMNKKARRRDYLKAIPQLKKAGILTHANLIVGFPGETIETVEETISLIEEAKPDFFRAQLWYADPVTPVWKHKEALRIEGEAFNWSHRTMDYRQACNLIDEMFLSVENAIWLPQWGFELWSVFYLQRKGMSLSQVKTFIKCYNGVIKEKLFYPYKTEISPELLQSLKLSAQFDRGIEPDMHMVDKNFSAPYYKTARQFWRQEYSDKESGSNIAFLLDNRHEEDEIPQGDCVLPAVDKGVLDTLCFVYHHPLGSILLAIYSVLLSRLNGQEETTIVVAMGEKVAPLRLFPIWNLSFKTFLDHVQEKIQKSLEYEGIAFYILHHLPGRGGEEGARQESCVCPAFDVGYRFSTFQEKGIDFQNIIQSYPTVKKEIKLILEGVEYEDTVSLRYVYDKVMFRHKTIEALGSYLISILKEVSQNPECLVGEIVSSSETTHDEDDKCEVFNF